MLSTIFFSWQSDIRPAAACRTLIQDALEAAASALGRDGQLGVEPVIDRDTQNVPGAPDIGATILAKIDAAAAFVADVTIVGKTGADKPTPNPNVLVELGYALKALGPDRIILVQNVAFGGPEDLPFDLRQKRVMTYSSPAEASERATVRRHLQQVFEKALLPLLKDRPKAQPEVELTLSYERRKITQEYHGYGLVVCLKNVGRRRIEDWEIEFEMPTPPLDGTVEAMKVSERSDATKTFFRATSATIKQPLRPQEERRIVIGYHMDNALLRRQDDLFPQLVKARALIDGQVVAEVERTFRELQCF